MKVVCTLCLQYVMKEIIYISLKAPSYQIELETIRIIR